MYSVYKITNLINNKCYIGSSVQVKRRWRQHKSIAFNKNSKQYNYPLYRAFRKYGLENFKFEIICDDFNSIEAMQNYEKQMIYYYNSYNYGYNQTYETLNYFSGTENFKKYIQERSQKCAKVDCYNSILEIYNSYHDAARKNGYDENSASLIRSICKGQIRSSKGEVFKDLDNNGNVIDVIYKTLSPRRKKIYAINVLTLEEYFYESISDAARKNNIERKRIQACISGNQRFSIVHNLIFREMNEYGDIIEIENTPTIDEKIEQYNQTNPVINGERHNIREWCKIYNISPPSVYKRLKKGMDITTPKRR